MSTRYRLIEHDGPDEWIEGVFERSLTGSVEVGPGRRITATEVHVGHFDSLGGCEAAIREARSIPGVWKAHTDEMRREDRG